MVTAMTAQQEPAVPRPVLPGEMKWADSPVAKGFRAAWVLGGEKAKGSYILRVRAAKGSRLEPHSHPDERQTTVLSGSIRVGFGDRFAAGFERACDAVMVRLRAALDGLPVTLVHNAQFADGISTSLRAGVEALPPDTDVAVIALSD